MLKFQRIAVCLIALIGLAPCLAYATEGVKGQTVRPVQVDAKVKGCKIAKPGAYKVNPGDLIELDYTYPAVPQATPKKVDFKQTLIGAIGPSPLGIREVFTPDLVGSGIIAFYFDARKEGKESVTLIIDGEEYNYEFTVVKPK